MKPPFSQLAPSRLLAQAISIPSLALRASGLAVGLWLFPLCSTGLVAPLRAETSAAVTGTIRDTRGTPQMGAMVQIINLQAAAGDAAVAAIAFTDLHGRYSIPAVGPGKYELKATAALFLPAMRDNLQLRPGRQTVVNLTLSTLFEAVQWLPAQKRRADEPEDDWKWTLRSAENRPILRMLEDGPLVMVSTSDNEKAKPSLRARIAVESGDAGFGEGGLHNAFTVDSVLLDGSGVILRADLGSPETSYPLAPSQDLAAGYERKLSPMASVRTIASYQSHPEIVGGAGLPGLQALTMESAEQLAIGDLLAVEYGSELTGTRLESMTAATLRPFARVTLHPTDQLLLSYRFATARDLQGWEDMDAVEPDLANAVLQRGRNGRQALRMEQGIHQEASVGLKTGKGLLQAAYYRDNVGQTLLQGGGLLSGKQIAAGDVLADPTTQQFRMLGPGYNTGGFRVSANEPLTQTMWAVLEVATGGALATRSPLGSAATPGGLQSAAASLRQEQAEAVTVALRGLVAHSKTHVRASYRWQPTSTVAPVDAFNAFSDQPYFSFYLRQPLHLGRVIPSGFEALVDVTNLLAQGYHPMLSSDGRTLIFAQSPRTLRGGLSFTF